MLNERTLYAAFRGISTDVGVCTSSLTFAANASFPRKEFREKVIFKHFFLFSDVFLGESRNSRSTSHSIAKDKQDKENERLNQSDRNEVSGECPRTESWKYATTLTLIASYDRLLRHHFGSEPVASYFLVRWYLTWMPSSFFSREKREKGGRRQEDVIGIFFRLEYNTIETCVISLKASREIINTGRVPCYSCPSLGSKATR